MVTIRKVLFYILFCVASTIYSQDVGIGTDVPDAQSILDIQSTDKGILIPRMTTAQRNAIGQSAADVGLLIYNTSTNEFNYWDGTQWVAFPASGDLDWTGAGTGSMYPSTLTDNVGIGISTPTGRLHIARNNENLLYLTNSLAATNDTWWHTIGAGGQFAHGYYAIGRGPSLSANYEMLLIPNYGAIVTRYLASKSGNRLTLQSGTGGGATPVGISVELATNAQSAGPHTITSGNTTVAGIGTSNNEIFMPSSGTGTYTLLSLQPRINQTGPASGITRGIQITGSQLTNAVDFRAIDSDVNSGYQLHLSGTADSYIEGALGLGTNNPQDKLHVVGNIRMVDGNQMNNYIMTSDANGTGSWTDPNALSISDNDWTGGGTGTMYPANINDNVSIGTATSSGSLSIQRTYTVASNSIFNSLAGNINSGTITGIRNSFSVTGSVFQDGMSNTFTGAGSGTITGFRNYMANTGNNTHHGYTNSWSGTGSGQHVGFYNSFSAGTGTLIGMQNAFPGAFTLNGMIMGVNNTIDAPGNGIRYGMNTQISTTGSGAQYGVYSNLSGSGTGTRYGSQVQISGSPTGSAAHYGHYNNISSGGSGARYGFYNTMGGSGTGQQYGEYTSIGSSSNADQHGNYVVINNTGTGNKYGFRTSIGSTTNGTHYGLWSSVLKANSYAGYFLGNVAIGTSNGDIYTLPTARGTANQVMQTNGSGIVSWVDPSTITTDDADWLVETTNAVPTAVTDEIYHTGNVGIGMNAPDDQLDVEGSVQFNGDFINQELLGSHNTALQTIPFTNGVSTPLTGSVVSMTIQDGNGVNNSGVLVLGFARVHGGNLAGNTSSVGSYFIILQRDDNAAFSSPTVLTYTSGVCYIETPDGASSHILPFGDGGHISYVDNNLTAGTTYYYRLVFWANGIGITAGNYNIYQRDLNLVQIKR